MIVQERERIVYHCRICQKWYEKQTGIITLSCAVSHSPGTCCHYGEYEMEEPVMKLEQGL